MHKINFLLYEKNSVAFLRRQFLNFFSVHTNFKKDDLLSSLKRVKKYKYTFKINEKK